MMLIIPFQINIIIYIYIYDCYFVWRVIAFVWVTCILKVCEGFCKILEGRDLFQRGVRIASISGALPAHGYVLCIKSLTFVDLPAAVLNKKTPAMRNERSFRNFGELS